METSKASASGVDLTSELWNIEDATPIPCGQVDLRFTSGWATGPSTGDGDDTNFQPSLVWGARENVEVSLGVPIEVGQGGGDPLSYDTNLGFLWRLHDQVEYHPAIALSGTVRLPTGDINDDFDGELRLVLTNAYDSGLRSHVNIWGKSANNGDLDNERDFQYGAAIGLDGVLCADHNVRWVADYATAAGTQDGFSQSHIVELGWEWTIDTNQKLGMSGQFSVDRVDEVPDFGARLTYAYTLVR
jgi:hypothetical protein